MRSGTEEVMATLTAPRPAHHAPRGYYREAARAGAPSVAHRASRAQLRLRRTVALLVLATAALLAVFVLGRASVNAAPAVDGQGSATPVVYTVQPGDTLWAIATKVAPKSDPRQTVHLLRELNGLTSGAVEIGQQLTVPN